MSLTAHITTADGVEHPAAFGLVYPLSIVSLADRMEIRADIHCWHSEAAFTANAAELAGFPATVSWSGAEAGQKLVETLAGLADITWVPDALTNAINAKDAIVAALETAVVAVDTRFSREG
jgi:hypothetical protein